MERPPAFVEVAPGVSRFADTCNVYVLRAAGEAVLVDFGSGAVLDALPELGVERVTDVLVTHHHRDQVQGLARADAAGVRIWVPPVERELVAGVDRFWATRELENDYSLRQDRFSLLDPVPVAGTVPEYRVRRFGGFDVLTLPTPGHTVGSVTYLVEVDGRRLAFTGDLVHRGGRLWSLAATQWTYSGWEGEATTILSCLALAEREPDVLLPSHGEPVDQPARDLARLRERLHEVIALRRGRPWDIEEWYANPWAEVTPHVLRSRASMATSYALLSDSGTALLLDWGYDFWIGTPLGSDRAGRRPLLASIAALKRDHGVDRVEVAVPTHYHDDHVAGLELLRDVEGAQVWAPEHVGPVLEHPTRYDLPCLWYDPVPVDRTLPSGAPVAWREYELTAYPLPGHTLFAAAIAFEADGKRFLATGDQEGGDPSGGSRLVLNYQYRNRYAFGDFVASAELYRRLRPDLMLTGHHGVEPVDEERLDQLLADGTRLAELHRELLPLEDVDFGAGGFGARIEPYRSAVRAGEELELDVTVRNPFAAPDVATVRLVVPGSWRATPAEQELRLAANAEGTVRFRLAPDGGGPVSRARVAADLTVGGRPFGQQAEALVDVE